MAGSGRGERTAGGGPPPPGGSLPCHLGPAWVRAACRPASAPRSACQALTHPATVEGVGIGGHAAPVAARLAAPAAVLAGGVGARSEGQGQQGQGGGAQALAHPAGRAAGGREGRASIGLWQHGQCSRSVAGAHRCTAPEVPCGARGDGWPRAGLHGRGSPRQAHGAPEPRIGRQKACWPARPGQRGPVLASLTRSSSARTPDTSPCIAEGMRKQRRSVAPGCRRSLTTSRVRGLGWVP